VCLLLLWGGGGGCWNLEKTGVLGLFAGQVSFKVDRPDVCERLLADADAFEDGDAAEEEEEEEEELRLLADPRRVLEGDPVLLLLLALSLFPRIGEPGVVVVAAVVVAAADALLFAAAAAVVVVVVGLLSKDTSSFCRGGDHFFCNAGAPEVDAEEVDADLRDARGDERDDDINFSPNARLIGFAFLSTWVEEDHPLVLLLLLLLQLLLLLVVVAVLLLLLLLAFVLLLLLALVPGRGSVRCFRTDLVDAVAAAVAAAAPAPPPVPDDDDDDAEVVVAESSGDVFLMGL